MTFDDIWHYLPVKSGVRTRFNKLTFEVQTVELSHDNPLDEWQSTRLTRPLKNQIVQALSDELEDRLRTDRFLVSCGIPLKEEL